jgi:hypothetical protein
LWAGGQPAQHVAQGLQLGLGELGGELPLNRRTTCRALRCIRWPEGVSSVCRLRRLPGTAVRAINPASSMRSSRRVRPLLLSSTASASSSMRSRPPGVTLRRDSLAAVARQEVGDRRYAAPGAQRGGHNASKPSAPREEGSRRARVLWECEHDHATGEEAAACAGREIGRRGRV